MLKPIRRDKPVGLVGARARPGEPGPSIWRARAKAWQAAQKMDLPRVGYVSTKYDPRPAINGRYSARIRGQRLKPGALPLIVRIGGELLVEMRFSPDGRTLNGRLRRKPRSKRVVLDYGFALVRLRMR